MPGIVSWTLDLTQDDSLPGFSCRCYRLQLTRIKNQALPRKCRTERSSKLENVSATLGYSTGDSTPPVWPLKEVAQSDTISLLFYEKIRAV